MNGSAMPTPRTFRLRSEFAMVEVEIAKQSHATPDSDDQCNVTIRDLENGLSITLDVLELECLTRMKHDDFGPMIVDHYPVPEGAVELLEGTGGPDE